VELHHRGADRLAALLADRLLDEAGQQRAVALERRRG
jgi:hypothetical protein